jgi:hypothetical protein
MVMAPEIYALCTLTPWSDWTNPGPHPPAGNTTIKQGNNCTLYEANKIVYDSQQNLKGAVNEALNIAVPQVYRKAGGIKLAPMFSPYKMIRCKSWSLGQLQGF